MRLQAVMASEAKPSRIHVERLLLECRGPVALALTEEERT